MTIIKVPVDFTIEGNDLDDAADQFNIFLQMCYRDYAKQFGVIDYELPVGYPAEELNECHCS